MTQKTTKGTTTLADRFLNDARDTHRAVSLYLLSGFQLKGEVLEFDEETILLKGRGGHQLVMRSGVATMYPLGRAQGEASEWWGN